MGIRAVAANVGEPDLCQSCGEDLDDHTLLFIHTRGEVIGYTVPSFPVLEVKFTHVKYAKDDSMTSYDGFIRETSELVKVNTMISVCTGCKNSFFIPMDEFMKSNIELELNTFDNN